MVCGTPWLRAEEERYENSSKSDYHPLDLKGGRVIRMKHYRKAIEEHTIRFDCNDDEDDESGDDKQISRKEEKISIEVSFLSESPCVLVATNVSRKWEAVADVRNVRFIIVPMPYTDLFALFIVELPSKIHEQTVKWIDRTRPVVVLSGANLTARTTI